MKIKRLILNQEITLFSQRPALTGHSFPRL